MNPYRDRPPRIDPSTPRITARPTFEPTDRAALFAAESSSPSWCPPRGPVVPKSTPASVPARPPVADGGADAGAGVDSTHGSLRPARGGADVAAVGLCADSGARGASAGCFDSVRAFSFSYAVAGGR